MKVITEVTSMNGSTYLVSFKSLSNRKFNKEWLSDELESMIVNNVESYLCSIFKNTNNLPQDFKFLLYCEPSAIKDDYIESNISIEISNEAFSEVKYLFSHRVTLPNVLTEEVKKIEWLRFYSITEKYVIDRNPTEEVNSFSRVKSLFNSQNAIG